MTLGMWRLRSSGLFAISFHIISHVWIAQKTMLGDFFKVNKVNIMLCSICDDKLIVNPLIYL